MKTKTILSAKWLGSLLIIGLISAFTFKSVQIEKPYLGNWQTTEANLKVRTKNKGYVFTNVTVPVNLKLNNNTASGNVGDVKFNEIPIVKNKGNSNNKGIIYIIKCGEVGSLSATDTAAKKKLEIWVTPIKNTNQLTVEVRQMFPLDAFPMGEVILNKAP